MYCNSCGHLNDDSMNYCTNDGAKLPVINSKNTSLKKGESTYCSSCGSSGQSMSNYCTSCGKNQFQLILKKDVVLNSTEAVINSIGLSNSNVKKATGSMPIQKLKTALIGTIIAFIIVILASFIINHFASEKINEFLESEGINSYGMGSIFEELEEEADIPKPDPFMGVTDYVLLSHMVDSEVSANVDGDAFEEDFNYEINIENATGTFILLLVPFLALLAGGFFYARRNPEDTVTERFKAAAIIGAGYGILLALTTIFGGFSYDAKIDEDFGKAVIEIDNNYGFFSALVNGFIFGTLFAGIGSLIQAGSLKTTGHLSRYFSSGESVHQAIGTFFRGVFIMFAVAFIAMAIELKDVDEKEWGILLVFCAQAGLYLWNLLNLPSLKFSISGEDEEGSLTYSLIGGIDEDGSHADLIFFFQNFFEEVINLEKILYPSIFVMIALFVYAGYRIAVKSGGDLKHVLIYSLTYSLLLSFFVAITKIGVVMKADEEFGSMMEGELFVGFSVFSSFLFSFFLSAVLAYGGSYIAKITRS
jgi:hypothetical protein